MKYKHLALGGTFDLLHRGHRQFLISAFKYADKITIGITSDSMATSKGKPPIDDFRKRRAIVVKFLKSQHFKKWRIIELNDAFGIAADDKDIDAILVSAETKPAAVQINRVRVKAKLSPLQIISVGMVLATDGKRISTGRIKDGEINREGLSYLAELTRCQKFLLPDFLRGELAKAAGEVFESFDKSIGKINTIERIFVVGDASVYNFLKIGIVPDLSVIDFKIERKNVYQKIEDLGFGKGQKYTTVNNDAGTITIDLVIKLFKALSKKQNVVRVIGEEDLAVLPLVLMAPLGSTVVYGLRGQGLVAVNVSEKTKSKFFEILELFEKSDN